MIPLAVGGILKVVSGEELLESTNQGWELVGVFQEKGYDAVSQQYYDAHNPGVVVEPEPKIYETTFTNFLVKLAKENVLAENKKTIEELRAKVELLSAGTTELEEAKELALKNYEKLAGSFEELKKKLKYEREEYSVERTQLATIKQDMAKVRETLGTERLNDILEV